MGNRRSLGLGFLGDVIDYFVFENPSELSVVAELGWTSLFLLTVAAVEGMLWLIFRTYNQRQQSQGTLPMVANA